jgi:hypothetical protein
MAEYHDSEYFTDSKEEIAQREADEALRRVVRTEIRRVHSGAADEDIANDLALEEAEEMANRPRKYPNWVVWISKMLTGEILIADEAQSVYNLFTLLGVILMLNLAVIFASLSLDLQCNTLKKEVERLEERAIRTMEMRTQQTSHSSIMRQLQKRGIEINDPKSTPIVIK